MPDIFNTNAQPDLAAATPGVDAKALMQLAQMQQPTRQPASTGTQATAQVNASAVKSLTQGIADWMNAYRAKMQQMGGAQGQPQAQAPPVTWNVTPQRPGPPMNIVPPGAGY